MTGKTHVKLAIATALGMTLIPEVNTIITTNGAAVTTTGIYLAASTLGGLFPDIDVETSTLGKLVPFIGKLCNLKPNSVFAHRGFFHSVWFPVLALCAALYGLSIQNPFIYIPAAGFLIGNLSHILGDISVGSVKLFAPFTKKEFSILHLKGHKTAYNIADGIANVLSAVFIFGYVAMFAL